MTNSVTESFLEIPIAAFSQEIFVLGVFILSFLTWKWLRGTRPSRKDEAKRDLDIKVRAIRRVEERFPLPKPNLVPTIPDISAVQAVEQQMLKHLDQREFTRALNTYRTMERDGRDKHLSEDLFFSFIQSGIRVGKVDVVERMLRTIKRNQLVPTLRFWQTTLKMLSSRKHFNTCLSIHNLFGKQIPADKVIYSCLINAALEKGVPERASAMLEKYGESGIDAKDYVLFFRTYVAINDVDSAERVFRKLGSKMTTLMLNLLLLACVNAKQPKRAYKLLEEAHMLEKDSPERIVDVVSYNTAMKGFAQTGMPDNCFDCLHNMLTHNLEPDDITLGTLLDACIVDNNVCAANEIVALLLGNDRPMDTVMCTLFIKGLVRGNCVQTALELYEEMNRRDASRPDIITYSVLVKALVDQHDLDRALQLVEDMKNTGHKPDDIILTHLLEGCRHIGNHALGKKLFKEILAQGVKPSEFTLVTMLKLHGRCGAHKEAHDLVAGWESQQGLKPSVIHYTCLMSGCLRTKSYDDAWAAYDLMCSNGVLPDETALSTLLPGMVAAQQWDRALIIARQALKAPTQIRIPVETMNNALSQMLASGNVGKCAIQMQALMKEAEIPITTRNTKRLISPLPNTAKG